MKPVLMADEKVRNIPELDNQEPIVDLYVEYPELMFDLDRKNVQKKSASIALGRRRIGEMLVEAQNRLPTGYRLLVKECYRPWSIQKQFWSDYFQFLKKKYPDLSDISLYWECSKYIAPLDVAPHCTGGAVDVMLVDSRGREIPMGCSFNADPVESSGASSTAAQNISEEARLNRSHLWDAMTAVGFVNYPTEWWHWSYGDKYWSFQTGCTTTLYSILMEEPVEILSLGRNPLHFHHNSGLLLK